MKSDLEKYLAAMISGDVSNLPEPNSNVEKYLAKMLGVWDGELPTPLSRADVYLYHLALNGAGGGGEDDGEEEEDATFAALKTLIERPTGEYNVLSGLTTIGENAFYMAFFSKITLPESVVSVGKNAFYQNTSLSDIRVEGPATLGTSCFAVSNRNSVRTNSIEMPDVVEIGESAFLNRMLAFEVLDLPKCKAIGASAFKESWGTYGKLATVNIPACETIGGSAFYSATCKIVKTRNLKSIGSEAFRYSSVKNFIMAGNQVATLSSTNAFSNINGGTYFYVHLDLMDQYKAATNWTTYADNFYPIVATVGDLAGIDGATYARAYVDAVDCIYVYDGAAWSQEGA